MDTHFCLRVEALVTQHWVTPQLIRPIGPSCCLPAYSVILLNCILTLPLHIAFMWLCSYATSPSCGYATMQHRLVCNIALQWLCSLFPGTSRTHACMCGLKQARLCFSTRTSASVGSRKMRGAVQKVWCMPHTSYQICSCPLNTS